MFFRGEGGLTLSMQIFQVAKMSLFSYILAFICMDSMEHRSFGGGGAFGGGTSAFGIAISPPPRIANGLCYHIP